MKQSKRRKEQRQRAGWPKANLGADDFPGTASEDEVDDLILAAAHANCEGPDDGAHVQPLIDALAQGLGLERGRERRCSGSAPSYRATSPVCSTPAGLTTRSVRVVRRRAGATAASIVAGPLVVAPTSPEWRPRVGVLAGYERAQARPCILDLESHLSTAIAVLSILGHLPALPYLGNVGSRTRNPRSHEQERLFTRIRGLLTKAESSDFAEEADAFMAKAQELMTRYCIDRTMVEADAEGEGSSQVGHAVCGWRTRTSRRRRSCWPTSPVRIDAGPLSIGNSASPPWSDTLGISTQRTCSSRPCLCRQRGASRCLGTIRRTPGVLGSRHIADRFLWGTPEGSVFVSRGE